MSDNLNYEKELLVAVQAVRAAANLCRSVQANLITADTLEKKDKSPVTVADFASQAIVCSYLQQAFPQDQVVGEEDSTDLQHHEQVQLRHSVVTHVGEELGGDLDEAQVLNWIDHGNADATQSRYWTLDPIVGTKGFLSGPQYAIALALIEQGEVVLGVLGCPNMLVGEQLGGIFTATKEGVARMFPLADTNAKGEVIHVSQVAEVNLARFCESVESGHSNQTESAQIAALLGIATEPYRIDSQCKYAAVARNDASIYLRLPTRADYQEKIWDHAAGKIIVEAAGGKVTDMHGNPLDFSRGRLLDNNQGVVATGGAIHDQVIEAIQRVRGQTNLELK